jgi:hypothetical protein
MAVDDREGAIMKTIRLNVFLVTLVIALTGFSPPVFTASIPAAKPDKGLVVFYRPSRAKGAAIRFEIFDVAHGSLGQLTNGTIIHRDLDPGSYTFKTSAPSVSGEDTIVINVEAGKTYYVKGDIIVGWPTWRPIFRRVSESEGKSDLEKFN